MTIEEKRGRIPIIAAFVGFGCWFGVTILEAQDPFKKPSDWPVIAGVVGFLIPFVFFFPWRVTPRRTGGLADPTITEGQHVPRVATPGETLAHSAAPTRSEERRAEGTVDRGEDRAGRPEPVGTGQARDIDPGTALLKIICHLACLPLGFVPLLLIVWIAPLFGSDPDKWSGAFYKTAAAVSIALSVRLSFLVERWFAARR